MAKVSIYRTTTGYIARVRVQDSTSATGGGLTGLVYNSSGLGLSYIRQGDPSATSVTLAAGTVGTWSSGGFKEVSSTLMPGVYEIGLPNAAVSSGASVLFDLIGAANMVDCPFEAELTATNSQDGVRAGLTALPNAAAGAVNGLPTGDASGRVLLQPTQSGVTIPTVTALTNAVSTNANATETSIAALVTNTNQQANAQAGLTAQGYTTARAGYLDTLNGLVAATATAVWNALTSALTTAGSIGKKLAAWVLGTDNKALLSTDAQTGVTIPTVTTLVNAPADSASVTAIKAKTDLLAFTSGNVNAATQNFPATVTFSNTSIATVTTVTNPVSVTGKPSVSLSAADVTGNLPGNVIQWGGANVTGMPLPTGTYTAPANGSIATILADVTTLLATAGGALTTGQAAALADIQTKVDKLAQDAAFNPVG